VRAELVIVKTPDGSGKLELTKYYTPADDEGAHPSPANRLGIRHIAFVVRDLDTIVNGLLSRRRLSGCGRRSPRSRHQPTALPATGRASPPANPSAVQRPNSVSERAQWACTTGADMAPIRELCVGLDMARQSVSASAPARFRAGRLDVRGMVMTR
jgi:hypothetical protein